MTQSDLNHGFETEQTHWSQHLSHWRQPRGFVWESVENFHTIRENFLMMLNMLPRIVHIIKWIQVDRPKQPVDAIWNLLQSGDQWFCQGVRNCPNARLTYFWCFCSKFQSVCNLSPLRPSKFSFEYLLLTPRSAPTTAPLKITLLISKQPLHLPTYCHLHQVCQ